MDALLFTLVVGPFIAALVCLLVPLSWVRSGVVLATGAALMGCSLMLMGAGAYSYDAQSMLGLNINLLIQFFDFVLLGVILAIGIAKRHVLISSLAAVQIALIAWLEFVQMEAHAVRPLFYLDELSITMVMVVSIVGSLICFYAIPYMKKHESHSSLAGSRQPKFFAVLMLFLGAMNGLVLANDLLHLYFFFEITTLCSYLLIGHDGTKEAVKNSLRALWMNSVGGVAFALALVTGYAVYHTTSIQEILMASPDAQYVLIPVALLALAGFTKAAQLPFQSWLLGAMVAPTPTSALLHSSTMVKAGVYIVIRFAPAMADTPVSVGVALVGAFTFLAAAFLALGQSNGKKILAYSTISNLGLILACAGLNTPLAITAAILLIVFHAVSKGLLFLSMGTIEQEIGSRDIEDQRGLVARMPFTATIAVLAMLTMILPPFGMLVGKWLAIQSAQANLGVIILLALGSAVNLIYWVRWAGSIMAAKPGDPRGSESLPILKSGPVLVLLLGAAGMSLAAPVLFGTLQTKLVALYNTLVATTNADTWVTLDLTMLYVVYPLFAIALIGMLGAWLWTKKAAPRDMATPYMSGIGMDDGYSYLGPMNQPRIVSASHYYLTTIIKEQPMTLVLNLVSLALLFFMLGGGL